MALSYKLEYCYDNDAPSDSSVYMHLRVMPPVTRRQTKKEDYDQLSEAERHVFLDNIFNIPGVEEVSCTAYRLWVMKSPAFTWTEINTAILDYLKTWSGETEAESMQGSANIDGSGFTLNSSINRRER